MKTNLLSLASLLFIALIGSAQSPSLVAKFGVDGDLSNDTLRLGAGTPAGSHDWFKQKAGTGTGLIDTAGTSIYNPMITAGTNVSFTRGQSVSRFAIVDNMYMLDARYGRDGFGLSAQSGKKDSTVFLNGNQGGGVFYSNKNGDNPNNWHHAVGGSEVQNKNDIIDIYAHLRRNGTDINATNPSPLYLYAAASTLGVEGERNIDFELFKSRISFNPATGFSNAGPNETGGHSVWTFNTDGTVKSTGDMLVSFNYNTSSVSDISVFIWVAASTKNSLNPLYFDFIPSEFFGEGPNPAYGYCKITQNGGLPNFEFYATANSFQSSGPFWGTSSKDLGSATNNYAANNYAAGQFSEIAINLTSLGIDPALGNSGTTTDPCAPPFTRIIVKTRASNTYTAELKDFTGPYPFLDAPQVPQQIKPANLTCTTNTTTLEPLNPQAGAFYVWTTIDGNILTNPISSSITVSGEGKYYLTASIVNGCLGQTDSIILTRDTYQPIATASVIGSVNHAFPNIQALLKGGDETASNFFTPYGNSAGLSWEWRGPNGFSASTKDANTNIEGDFMLIVTELRNGCKDTAYTKTVSAQTLPVRLTSFTATLANETRVELRWTTASEINTSHFNIERSTDGTNYTTAGMVFANGTATTDADYQFPDNISSLRSQVIYYRLKSMDNDGKSQLSEVRIVRIGKSAENTISILTYPNPARNEIQVTIPNEWQNKTALYEVFNTHGQLVMRRATSQASQTQQLNISMLAPGLYYIKVICDNQTALQKIVKQ
jgi:Secretion system C-terminal sorting domain